MVRWIVMVGVLSVVGAAWAQEGAPPGAPDMSRMGPFVKKPTNPAKTQKELKEWFQAWAAAGMRGDVDAMADAIDFPVLMMSDSMAGKFSMMQLDRTQWTEMMRPFMTPEAVEMMKGMKHSEKCFLMSDDLASCEGTVTMKMGKQRATVNNHMILTRVDGRWKAKSMMEAGWGDMSTPPQ